MFLVRSAFWLGLAFVIIQPQGMDFGAKANAIGSSVTSAGQDALLQQVDLVPCSSFECAGGKAVLLASDIMNNSSQASTMQDSLSLKLAPVPRPRPDWAS